jgi:hypothetical protein
MTLEAERRRPGVAAMGGALHALLRQAPAASADGEELTLRPLDAATVTLLTTLYISRWRCGWSTSRS